jgi:hypothetical protein
VLCLAIAVGVRMFRESHGSASSLAEVTAWLFALDLEECKGARILAPSAFWTYEAAYQSGL